MYSGFENLYLRVEMNFGFISTANDLTSSQASYRSSLLYPVNFSRSSSQQFVFLNYLAERMRDAPAICDGANLKSDASRRATS